MTPTAAMPRFAFATAVLSVTFFWAYWSTLEQMVSTWNNQPDYSHGFLVPILTLFFLWLARDRFPGFSARFAWWGLAIVLLATALRVIASYFYFAPLDGWTIPLWIGGAVLFVGGWPLARWSAPAILFLYFMIPLPFRMERWLSLPLQEIATRLSVWTLQCLGQPAIAEGHTIHLGAHRLEVEQACSGLRMLVGISALAVAHALIVRKSWWERALLLASVIPVSLGANTIRIAGTGLLYQYASGSTAKAFAHDFAGWVMIPVAAVLFAAVSWYFSRLFPEHEVLDLADLVRTRQVQGAEASRPA